ncbi:hypothetical protein Slin15195_G091670 [Septoria linicola]|uniref:Uncharacterized protein n=1 Tax=Septoria linicola TaxID=215465 RepID=A0A9Q9ENV1_9PEZI|nr:hypothetical protein Slin15195_G091670 [Septoria linicola]
MTLSLPWYKGHGSTGTFEAVNSNALGLPETESLHRAVSSSVCMPWASDSLFMQEPPELRLADLRTLPVGHFLVAWTSTARFAIVEDGCDSFPQRGTYGLVQPGQMYKQFPAQHDRRGRAGRLIIHNKDLLLQSTDGTHEFIVINEASESETCDSQLDQNRASFYNIMMIARDIHGTASRIGLREAYKSAFVAAEPQWARVTLR